MHFFVFKKQSLFFVLFLFILIPFVAFWFFGNSQTVPTINEPSDGNVREIHLVTGEFEAKTVDGKEIEAYRWDPGTIFLSEQEKVLLKIYGVNGREHPFMIEGTDIKGTVKQGAETVVEVQFDKEGIYRLICLTHPDIEHNGPMIAYIVVD